MESKHIKHLVVKMGLLIGLCLLGIGFAPASTEAAAVELAISEEANSGADLFGKDDEAISVRASNCVADGRLAWSTFCWISGTGRHTDSGRYVKAVQTILLCQGYYGLDATFRELDGDLGPKTHGAIIRYQQDHGLSADGIVGPKTWLSLRSELTYDGIANFRTSRNTVYAYNVKGCNWDDVFLLENNRWFFMDHATSQGYSPMVNW
ncbi:MAG: peptidoglycan-binding domain-containing protein [Chloroflexota bacterium]